MRDKPGVLTLSLLCSALISANAFAAVSIGEQHLHTSDSPDAFAMGTRNSPDDAKAQDIEPPSDVPATIQERARSLPIWYTPEAKLVKRAGFYPGLQEYLP